jgi:hypothetical protein
LPLERTANPFAVRQVRPLPGFSLAMSPVISDLSFVMPPHSFRACHGADRATQVTAGLRSLDCPVEPGNDRKTGGDNVVESEEANSRSPLRLG